MARTRIFTGAIAAMGLFALCLTAQNAAPRKGIFVTNEQLDVAKILPAPAPDNSARQKEELAEVHRLQKTRTPAAVAQAKADDEEEDMFIFRNVLGEKFRADALPQTALFSAHLHNDEPVIGGAAKATFRRLRPFNFDSTVKPVCKTNGNREDYGYPSGHSLTGYLEALALIQIVPEKRDAILARADEYAHNRVVCGVHYPSDTQASKLAAYAMMGIMVNNPQFKKELDAARAETRHALGL